MSNSITRTVEKYTSEVRRVYNRARSNAWVTGHRRDPASRACLEALLDRLRPTQYCDHIIRGTILATHNANDLLINPRKVHLAMLFSCEYIEKALGVYGVLSITLDNLNYKVAVAQPRQQQGTSAELRQLISDFGAAAAASKPAAIPPVVTFSPPSTSVCWADSELNGDSELAE